MHVDPTTARDPLQRTPHSFTPFHERDAVVQRLPLAVGQARRLIAH